MKPISYFDHIPYYQRGEIITINPQMGDSAKDYLILDRTPNNRGIFALPIKPKAEELNIQTLETLYGKGNIRATGKVNYMA